MAYIVTAEVYKHCEMNTHGDAERVEARVLRNDDGYITFQVKGEFGEEKRIVGELVRTLLDAGYYEFRIAHSY
ncbi:hypothetical protein [Burkholderia sp. Ac-20365]|uniref:hypothetical protein n=1 Tax=Burkholderia sp. Ac-20365 TaxID=2703897 RepID=UPI00197B1B3C|nr:hypothetical protein [Burkholderia sp. Ac-20365]MBN3761225.1 hypothetical protein [Burkholderia sp. Ac-20365]